MTGGTTGGTTGGPRIDVVGLGPAGPELLTARTLELLEHAPQVFLRTSRHPAASIQPDARTFDHHYEASDTFDDVYRTIVADLVDAAITGGPVVYAVPGSPTVAERTVVLLAGDPRVTSGQVTVVVHPSVSFLDVAFARLGVDPVASGVRIVDAERFAVDAAGERGPLLVAQCWSRDVLSDVKLSVETPPETPVTVLHHLGLADERVWELPWEEIDRSFEPDHLTSLWIPCMAAPVAAELVALDELVHTLRERCPWDRSQTHASLSRHLLEESYEVLESIDAVGQSMPTSRPEPSVLMLTCASTGPWPTSKRSLATCCSRCTSMPPWLARRAGSHWPTWPGESTTSWSLGIRTSSVM